MFSEGEDELGEGDWALAGAEERFLRGRSPATRGTSGIPRTAGTAGLLRTAATAGVEGVAFWVEAEEDWREVALADGDVRGPRVLGRV